MEDVVAGYFEEDRVLNDVSLHAAPGRVTVVLGPNGSGKSTALRVMAGFLRPREGRVLLDGTDVTALPAFRRIGLGLGFLAQGRSTCPHLSVDENLQLGAWAFRSDRHRVRRAVAGSYERYPALGPLRSTAAGRLSGGQQRLLEMARMLVADPRVVLVDEPSAGLSPKLADQAYEDLAQLRREGRTILLVDQNVRAAVALADEIYILAYGRNGEHGPREAFEGRLGEVVRGWIQVG
jgi:branched-chain amino acid transport system ATP-binding protein